MVHLFRLFRCGISSNDCRSAARGRDASLGKLRLATFLCCLPQFEFLLPGRFGKNARHETLLPDHRGDTPIEPKRAVSVCAYLERVFEHVNEG